MCGVPQFSRFTRDRWNGLGGTMLAQFSFFVFFGLGRFFLNFLQTCVFETFISGHWGEFCRLGENLGRVWEAFVGQMP